MHELDIGVKSDDMPVNRVAKRVKRRGHPVPEDKIRGLYASNGTIIRQDLLMSTRGFVFDNSVSGRKL